jgi:hypothetical protein
MTQAELDAEGRAFIDDYLGFWGTEKFAGLYHIPSVTVRADGTVHIFQSREEIERFFAGVQRAYDLEGAKRWNIVSLDVKPIGGQSALITPDWQMLRDDGSVVRGWRQSYNVVRVNGQFRVLVSTFHLP